MATIALLLLGIVGCAAPEKQVVVKDTTLIRHVDDGRQAFDEGDLGQAERQYRRALLRAWAIDDPYESGTVVYNLAACLVARNEFDHAADWLVDARVEFCRANSSAGNAWLLSAEIAMAQERFADADRYVNFASLACPPCDLDGSICLCGPSESCSDEECDQCCAVRLPCIGKHLREKKEDRDCLASHQARVELTKARLAARQFELCDAKRHLSNAIELSNDLCNLSLEADRHDVAALIHDLEGHFVQAGAHRDREVKLLRCIGVYREIPNVLDAAAESYRSAERLDLAVDRMVRSARIHLARGQLDEAWQRIRSASELAEFSGCEAVEIRLALTAKMIQESIPSKSPVDLDQPMVKREN